MLDMASTYWKMTTHIILFVTQLLSMLGIAAAINVQAWMYISLANMVVMTVLSVASLYAYNLYWDTAEDTTNSTAAEILDATAAMAWMENRMMVNTVFGTHYMLALYMHHKQWMMAQWMALDEETQMAWKEKHEMDKEHDDMDEDDMYVLFSF